MRLLAHRGWWREAAERNSLGAFERAWSRGWGIETDLRDRLGQLVVSHDPPGPEAESFENIVRRHAALAPATPLALNIKADGLAAAVAAAAGAVKDRFVFDMSLPDTLPYLRSGLPVFVRLSEYEPETALIERAAGVWLDAFEGQWWTPDTVLALLGRGKAVAVVSPELHGRPHLLAWTALKTLGVHGGLMLCTDHPEAAEAFFA